MAVPARRTSKTKKRMRRTHLKKVANNVVNCPNCGAPIQPHRACVSCGFYKGKDVLEKNDKKATKDEVKEVKEEKKETTKKTTSKSSTSKKETK